jgi:hypothetical protein
MMLRRLVEQWDVHLNEALDVGHAQLIHNQWLSIAPMQVLRRQLPLSTVATPTPTAVEVLQLVPAANGLAVAIIVVVVVFKSMHQPVKIIFLIFFNCLFIFLEAIPSIVLRLFEVVLLVLHIFVRVVQLLVLRRLLLVVLLLAHSRRLRPEEELQVLVDVGREGLAAGVTGEGLCLQLVHWVELLLQVEAPLGDGLQVVADVGVQLLHLNYLISKLADVTHISLSGCVVAPFEGKHCLAVVAEYEYHVDQLGLLHDELDRLGVVLVEGVHEDLGHLGVQDVVEGVAPEPVEQHVEQVVLGEQVRDLLGEGLVDLGEVLHNSYFEQAEGLLSQPVGGFIRCFRDFILSRLLQLLLDNIVGVFDKLV